ncbi:MAG: hypothetical protein HY363_05260 [Candidatus Aenigmarchaeota archaeon]|nr:hypothetical protein [Candidatus Aenigmarchaeota archaeon]
MINENKIFLIFIFVIAYLQWGLFADFQHIPGPVFGGDLYRERGFVQHILNGEPYWQDPYFAGELEFYPPIGYVLAAKTVQMTGWDVETVLNYFPIPVFILTALSYYYLGQVFFNKTFALLLVGVVATFQLVIPKHTLGIAMAFSVLSLAFYAANLKVFSRKKQILSGLFLGLTGLTHYSAFLITAMILSIGALLEIAYRIKTEKKISVLSEFANKLVIIVIMGLAMASFFIYPLYVKYGLATPNQTQIYSLFNPYAHGIEWVIGQFWNTLFPDNILRWLFGAMAVLGIWACTVQRKKQEQRTALFWMIAVIIGTSHYVITIPLFRTSVVPPHLWAGMNIPFSLMIIFGLRTLTKTLELKTGKPQLTYLAGFAVLIILPLIYQQYTNYNADRWVQYGKTMDPSTQAFYDVGKWIMQNTGTNEVFLAHDESSFAINALTGRKLVMVRRTHASPYVDVDKRYADSFVMLYGTNKTKISELMKEYNVKYLYADRFMMDTPMATAAKYADYLRQHGVNFTVGKSRYDPASTDTPLYDVVAVQGMPQAILNLSTEVQQFAAGQQMYAMIYKFEQ